MLITDRFVFVHFPKTGGTFVNRMIKTLLSPSTISQRVHSARKRYGVSLPIYPYAWQEQKKHAFCKLIPPEHSNKPIAACMRNPLDLYVSQYKFGWWRDHAEVWFVDLAAAEDEFTLVQEMDFDQFVRATLLYGNWCANMRDGRESDETTGRFSAEWIHFFCREPQTIRDAAPDTSAMLARTETLEYPVHFLLMERLNEDLADFLVSVGHTETEVAFIRTHQRVYPGRQFRPGGDRHQSYYTAELEAEVRRREAFLFARFPEYSAEPVPV